MIYVLDTNVLSAIMGSVPALPVAAWIASQPEDRLFTTTICQAEILASIEVVPNGRQRHALEAAANAMFAEDFDGRVLPFSSQAAAAYAGIFAARKRSGLPTAPLDLMVAAIAHANDAAVVTRDLRGFAGCGLTLINPWEVEVRNQGTLPTTRTVSPPVPRRMTISSAAWRDR